MPFFAELRQGLRGFARTPGFLLLAAGTLALGIGSTAVMFSVADSVIWRPLPFPSPERLVLIAERSRSAPADTSASLPNFLDWRGRARGFERIAALAYSGDTHVLTGTGERVRSSSASAGVFEALGVKPALGRTFAPSEEIPGAHLALLTDDFWRTHFAASPDAVSRTFTVDRRPYSVIGVLPPGFHLESVLGGDEPQFFVPLDTATPERRDNRRVAVVARLRGGVSLEGAAAEMREISHRLAAEYPKEDGGWEARTGDLRTWLTSYNRTTMYLFLGFAAFVLLIACANVAGLQLIRSVGRRREYAVRLALGARRSALLRQALAEACWIAIPGAAAGALLGDWGVAAIRAVMPPGSVVRAYQISMDLRALGFVLAVSVAVTFLVALVPVLLLRGMALDSALREGSKSVAAGPRTQRMVNILVAAEMTLSFLLLFGSGLFYGTHLRLKQVELGFDPRNILTARITSGSASHQTLFRDALDRASAIGGVRQAVWASAAPLSGGSWVRYAAPGHSVLPGDEAPQSLVRVVSPGYFELLRIPVLAGRAFTIQDAEVGPRVAIVNENLARAAFGGENPVGRSITILPGGASSIPNGPVTIVGLAANHKELGRSEVPFQDIYLPFAQNPQRDMTLLAKASGPAASVFARLREEVQKLDSDVALYDLQPLEEALDAQFRNERFRLTLVSIFALLAALLAGVGVYGAITFSVAQRRREFGLRIALGALPSAIRRVTLVRTARIAGTAVAAGAGIALLVGRLLGNALYLVPRQHSGVLYGIGMNDPLTMAVAAAIVVFLAAVASLEPAGRAARVEPSAALRDE